MRSARSRVSHRTGLSLAEILLSLSLIIGVLALVAGIFPFSYNADQKAWKKSSAQRIAGSMIEEMRGQEFDSLASSFNVVEVEKVDFEVTVTVTDVEPEPIKAKNVLCEVAWRTQNDRRERFVQETRIAEFLKPR